MNSVLKVAPFAGLVVLGGCAVLPQGPPVAMGYQPGPQCDILGNCFFPPPRLVPYSYGGAPFGGVIVNPNDGGFRGNYFNNGTLWGGWGGGPQFYNGSGQPVWPQRRIWRRSWDGPHKPILEIPTIIGPNRPASDTKPNAMGLTS